MRLWLAFIGPMEHVFLSSDTLHKNMVATCVFGKLAGLRNINIEMTKKLMSMTNSVVYFYADLSAIHKANVFDLGLSYPRVLSHPRRFNTEIWQQRSGSRF